MVVLTAPADYIITDQAILFLAGGITNCPDWQLKTIEVLKSTCSDERLIVCNPRRKNFPIGDESETGRQIAWEFKWLEKMHIFSMYFSSGISDQPICMYELGRNILRMQMRFPADWEKRVIITCEEGYKRRDDVLIQTILATKGKVQPTFVHEENGAEMHGQYICRAYKIFEGRT